MSNLSSADDKTRDLSFGCSEKSAFRNFSVIALQAAALRIPERVFFRNRGKILRRGFASRVICTIFRVVFPRITAFRREFTAAIPPASPIRRTGKNRRNDPVAENPSERLFSQTGRSSGNTHGRITASRIPNHITPCLNPF